MRAARTLHRSIAVLEQRVSLRPKAPVVSCVRNNALPTHCRLSRFGKRFWQTPPRPPFASERSVELGGAVLLHAWSSFWGEWALAIQHRSSFTPKFPSLSASLSAAEGYAARDEPRDHQKNSLRSAREGMDERRSRARLTTRHIVRLVTPPGTGTPRAQKPALR